MLNNSVYMLMLLVLGFKFVVIDVKELVLVVEIGVVDV